MVLICFLWFFLCVCISKFLSAFDIHAWLGLGVSFCCANESLCWQIDSVKSMEFWGDREAPNQSSRCMFLKIPPKSHPVIPDELFYRMLLLIIKIYQFLESFSHHPFHQQPDFK